MTDKVSLLLRDHYAGGFSKHGCTSQGVDWGPHEDRALLRHQKTLEVIKSTPCSLLDVGCGYGALLDVAKQDGLDYTGIDIVAEMTAKGRERHPQACFIDGDFLGHPMAEKAFDYVICNGILTQKLTASIADMDTFSKKIINKMFACARKGIAFNLMSTHVNFMADNLFYKSPLETYAWVTQNLSPFVRLDHTYMPFEYMVYVYRDV